PLFYCQRNLRTRNMFRQSIRPQFDGAGKAWLPFNGTSNLFSFSSLDFDSFREKFKPVQGNDLDRNGTRGNNGFVFLQRSVQNEIEGDCRCGKSGGDLEETFVGIFRCPHFWQNDEVLQKVRDP